MATPLSERDDSPLVDVRDLVVVHRTPEGDRPILDGVDLTVGPGEAVAIVGESGSGKSMLAKAISGLLPPGVVVRSGNMTYDGVELTGLSPKARARYRGAKMTLLFQDPFTTLNPLLRSGDHIIEGLELASPNRIPGAEGKREAIRRLAEVGIDDEHVADRYPFQLSGGMRQRVALAAALARDPALLLADEPSTALDVTTQAEILGLIKETQRARGMSMIFISHDLRVAFSVCDRVYVLYAGSVMEVGKADRVTGSPRHPYTHGLLLSEPTARGRQADLYAIEGSVPRPGEVRHRCAFADRCRWMQEKCVAERPPLLELGDGEASRCIRTFEISDEMRQERLAVKEIVEPAETAEENTTITRATDLVKVFNVGRKVRVQALRGVSLEIRRGESVGLVGESGSGKTTIGRCLVGLETPTEGKVEMWPAGQQVIGPRDPRARRFVQVVFQDPYSSLDPRQTIGSTLVEPLRHIGVPAKEAVDEAARLLVSVGLPTAYLKRTPSALSGGERQRVAIARALSVKPELLVCDEPVSALDVSVQSQILRLFRELRDELGLSLLFITHDMAVVRQIADSVHILHDGKIVESGQVDEVLDNPSDEYTKRLIASIPGEQVA